MQKFVIYRKIYYFVYGGIGGLYIYGKAGDIMDEKVKNELNNIVQALSKTDTISRIYLFGSYSRGEETEDSDIDLCVLTTEKIRDHFKTAAKYRLEIIDIKTMALDLIAENYDDFYFHAKRPSSFYHEIAEKGVLLYAR